VPEHMGGHVVVETGAVGDAGDHVVCASGAEPVAALVEEQRGAVFAAGPVRALGEPACERGVQLWVDRDVTDAFAVAAVGSRFRHRIA
jgi:hypothetical protein